MTTIISGNTLGLSLTSLSTVGQLGISGNDALGRSRERVAVNIATGNLVLQGQDDRLVARGEDMLAVRTYNSLGRSNDGNGDNWTVGFQNQRVALSGKANRAGSTVTRTDRTDCADQLVHLALEGGARDNVSAIVADVVPRTDPSTAWQPAIEPSEPASS